LVHAVTDDNGPCLASFDDGRLELYNLKDDVSEEHDLASDMAQKRDELHSMLKDWRGEVEMAVNRFTGCWDRERSPMEFVAAISDAGGAGISCG